MKKRVIVGFILLLFSIFSTLIVYTKTNKEYIIKKTLENKYYSYLPQEAKEYIEEVYEETGQIIKTEKNREENVPYLSPKYVEYLSLTKEEQKEVSEIPKQYDIYFKISETPDELPTTFNLNDDNHITELKNQTPLNLCWAFATVEQTESNLMIKQSTPRNLTFSTRQIDYASSTNGIKDYDNENGMRELSSGGNFLVSSLILYNGLGLYNDLVMPFNTDQSKKEVSEVLNYNNVLYELNSGILLPTMTNNSTSEEWENYRNKLKQLIMENGGAYVGTQAPGYSCSSKNINNNTNYNNTSIIRVDNCTQDGNHAMQIIGWDDNYDYSYCKAEKEINNETVYYHSENVSSCSNSNLVTGKGAWILRNSWGTTEAYIYLAYDSIEDDVFVFSDFSSTQNKNWDNNYHDKVNLKNLYQTTSETKTFHKIDNNEKVEKIKLFTYGKNGEYKISITSKNHNYNNVKQVTIPNMGINTIDLSDKNILIGDEEFSVKIESINGVRFITDTMSIFTSNVSQNSIIKTKLNTEDNRIKFDISNTSYSFRVLSNTRNISSGEVANYSLEDYKGNNENNYLNVQNNIVAINNINVLVNLSSEIKPGYHTLTINHQETTEDIEILIGDGKVNVHFFANDSTENNMIQRVDILNPGSLQANSFIRDGYIFLGWNTKADGTGIDYIDQQELESIDEDLNLYAIWIPNKYTITFDANGGTGEMEEQEFTYGVEQQLKENAFIKEGYTFDSWNTKSDGTGTQYTNQQVINNFNNDIILYAIWKEILRPITNISMNNTSLELTIWKKDTEQLTVTIEPENTTDNKNITWSSNNPSIASINQNGLVTAKDKGVATITARTSNGLTATCIVTVKGKTGWIIQSNDKYYYNDGEMLKGIQEIGGKRYLLGINSGKLYTGGLATIAYGPQEGTYYVNKNGIVQIGQQSINGEKYYFDDQGRMQKGIIEVEGKRYLYGISSGKLYTGGLATIAYGPQEGTYYVNKNGIIQIGQQSINGEEYYFDDQGRMQKGILKLHDGDYLYGFSSGKLYKNGLATIPDGKVYLTDNSGKILYGKQEYENNEYYFDENGMYKGILETEEGNYLFGYVSGKLFKDALATTPDGRTYRTDKTGKILYEL